MSKQFITEAARLQQLANIKNEAKVKQGWEIYRPYDTNYFDVGDPKSIKFTKELIKIAESITKNNSLDVNSDKEKVVIRGPIYEDKKTNNTIDDNYGFISFTWREIIDPKKIRRFANFKTYSIIRKIYQNEIKSQDIIGSEKKLDQTALSMLNDLTIKIQDEVTKINQNIEQYRKRV
jgi:hypothetical protein